jgi:hypothetical protein
VALSHWITQEKATDQENLRLITSRNARGNKTVAFDWMNPGTAESTEKAEGSRQWAVSGHPFELRNNHRHRLWSALIPHMRLLWRLVLALVLMPVYSPHP